MKRIIYPTAAVFLICVFVFNIFFNKGNNNSEVVTSPTTFTSTPVEQPVDSTDAPVAPEIAPVPEAKEKEAYKRSFFGKDWKSIGNSCDFRQKVLAEKMMNVRYKEGSPCKVLSGNFVDVYTGENVNFSSTDPNAVPIDHIFSLSEAWDAGAWEWTFQERVAFANDIENLTPTTQSFNSWKSDKSLEEIYNCVNDASYDCAPKTGVFVGEDFYIEAYTHIMEKYNLVVSDASLAIIAEHKTTPWRP